MAIAIRMNELEKLLPQATNIAFNKATMGFQNKQIVDQLNKRESMLLNQKFGVSSIEELREALNRIKEETPALSQLNGTVMRRMVLEFDRLLGKKIGEEEALFQQLLFDEFDKITNSNETTDLANETMEKFILDIVQQTMGETVYIGNEAHSGAVTSLTSLRGIKGINSDSISKMFLSKLAPVTQARIRLLIEKRYGTKTGGPRSTVKQEYNQIRVEVPLNWYEYTKGEKASTLNLSDEEIDKINLQFKDAFLAAFSGNVPKMPEILDYVFAKNKKVLFVGQSEQQIVGICGEIQALCYLSLLMGKNFSLGSSNSDVNWVAQELSDTGKQSHADILLGKFGIQVKNSTLELLDGIKYDFVDSTLDTFLENLRAENIISFDLKDYILNTYEAYYFNLPYVMSYDGSRKNKDYAGIASAGENATFAPLRQRIESLHSAIEATLERLTSILMYIGVGNAQKNRPSNVMFFVRGEIFLASEIINEVLNKIDNEINFSVQTSYGDSSFNIINLINDNGKHIFNYPGIVAYADDIVSKNIKIKSSYNFGSLLRSLLPS